MQLIFHPEAEIANYTKIGYDVQEGKIKNAWLFPDISKSFDDVKASNGMIIIDPSYYYITSGEALRKTEVLISDIKDALVEYASDDVIKEQLECLMADIYEFYDLLIKTKGESLYLEVTKCEDGIYNGNICARKDPKKKKKQ